MMAENHGLFAVSLYVATPAVGVEAPILGLAWVVWAAQWPDICSPSSRVSQDLSPFDNVIRSAAGLKHRGLTHKWAFLAALVTGLLVTVPGLALPIGQSYGSHLFGDGIPKTDGWLEWFIVRPFLWCSLFAGVWFVRIQGWQVAG